MMHCIITREEWKKSILEKDSERVKDGEMQQQEERNLGQSGAQNESWDRRQQ